MLGINMYTQAWVSLGDLGGLGGSFVGKDTLRKVPSSRGMGPVDVCCVGMNAAVAVANVRIQDRTEPVT